MFSRSRPPLSLLAAALLIATGIASAREEAFAAPPAAIATEATAEAALKPGEYAWHPEASPYGPVLIVVSIDDQRAYVYRNGVRIATTTVSTGRPGYDTPPGVFQILQKKKVHFSNLYDDAPMPYMQRLSWEGVALHAGRIPGRPASHGCIRLPHEFAQKLYGITYHGGTVVVTDTRYALDLASLPTDMAQLVLPHRGGWRAAALPG